MTSPDLEQIDEYELALEIARRFYLEDQSKVTIAMETGLSRFQVARILSNARRDGLVRIELGSPGHIDRRLGDLVAQRFGLRRAVIVHVGRTAEVSADELVGHALAPVLAELIREDDIVGVTWSRAIEAATRSLPRIEACTVVQISGTLRLEGDYLGTVEGVRRIARASGGIARPIHAPLIVDDPRTASSLRAQPEIAEVLALTTRLDVSVASVGSWSSLGSMVHDLLSADIREELTRKGAVGSIAGRVFDLEGRELLPDVGDLVVGVGLEELSAARTKIITSQGEHRVDSTIGAIRAGLVDVLVMDSLLAEALLARTG